MLLYSLAIIDLLQLSSAFSGRHRCAAVEIHCWGTAGLGSRFSNFGRAGTSVRMSNAALIFQQALELHNSEQPQVFCRTGTHLPPWPVPATVLSSSLYNYCMSATQAELRDRKMEYIQADLRERRKDSPVALI